MNTIIFVAFFLTGAAAGAGVKECYVCTSTFTAECHPDVSKSKLNKQKCADVKNFTIFGQQFIFHKDQEYGCFKASATLLPNTDKSHHVRGCHPLREEGLCETLTDNEDDELVIEDCYECSEDLCNQTTTIRKYPILGILLASLFRILI